MSERSEVSKRRSGKTIGLPLRSVAVRLGADCLFYSGVFRFLQGKAKAATERIPEHERGGFPFLVLLYHRVNPEKDPFFPSQSPRAFDGQMRYLAECYHVLPLSEVFERLREGREIEPYSIAVTFDDGYRDNLLYAHPILKKYGLRATLFVPTGLIETGQVLWNDRLAWAIKWTEKKEILLPSFAGNRTVPLRSFEEKRKALGVILEELKTYGEEEKKTAADVLVRELQNSHPGPEPGILCWAELRRLAEEGWEIGSHTVNHVILTRLAEAEARQELQASKNTLEKELQRPVRFLAYPNGKQNDFSPGIKAVVRETGYEGAVTTLGSFNSAPFDLFAIHRHSPWEEHAPSFAINLTHSYWRSTRTAKRRREDVARQP